MIKQPLKSKGRFMLQRTLALLLTFVLVVTLCPIAAFSDGDSSTDTAAEPDIAVYGADGSTELQLLATLTGYEKSTNSKFNSSLEVPIYLYKCSADTESIVIHYAPHYYTHQPATLKKNKIEAGVDTIYDVKNKPVYPIGMQMDLSGVEYISGTTYKHYSELTNPDGASFNPETNEWTIRLENLNNKFSPIISEDDNATVVQDNLGSFFRPSANYAYLELRKYAYLDETTNEQNPPIALIYIQIGESVPINTTALQTAIDRADDIIATSPNGVYYYDNDRFNGYNRRGYDYDSSARKYIINSNGFYHDMLKELEVAKAEINTLNQKGIESRAKKLNDAINKLIPRTYVNATSLYAIVNGASSWWTQAGVPRIEFHDGFENFAASSDSVVSEANTTPETYAPYKRALDEATAEYKKLFDYIGSDRHAAARAAIEAVFDSDNARSAYDIEEKREKLHQCFSSLKSPEQLRSEIESILSGIKYYDSNWNPKNLFPYAEMTALLDALFDENCGAPTGYNVYSDELQAKIDRLVANVETARNNLDKMYDDSFNVGQIPDATMAYRGIDSLANKVFNPRLMNEADYTPESWASFITARNTALEFLEAHSEPGSTIGYNAYRGYLQAYQDFFRASYEGLVSKNETINIKLSVTDNTPLLSDFAREQCDMVGSYELEISRDKTLGELLTEVLGTDYKNRVDRLHQIVPENFETIGIYINGVFAYYVDTQASAKQVESKNYENFHLNDGDEVVFAIFRQKTSATMLGYKNPVSAIDAIGDVRYIQFFSQNTPVREVNATSGEKLRLTLKSAYAMPTSINNVSIAEPGAPIFISECCATREEAMRAKLVKKTDAVSGTDGSFELSLYSMQGNSGWYLAAAAVTGEGGGLANGPSLLIHVTDPTDLSPIRAELKNKLSSAYTEYEDTFYTEAQLEQIREYYETGCADIDSASYSGAALNAFNRAFNGISAIKEHNVAALDIAIKGIANIMKHLPSLKDAAAGKQFYSDFNTFSALFDEVRGGAYTSMTQYQKEQLLSNETALIEKYKAVYDSIISGEDENSQLLPNQKFTMSFEVRDADTGEKLEVGFEEGQVQLVIEQSKKSLGTSFTKDDTGLWKLDGVFDGYVHRLERQIENPVATSIELETAPCEGELIVGFIDRSWANRIGKTVQTEYEICGADYNIDEHYVEDFSYSSTGATLSVNSPREDVLLTVYVRKVNDPARPFIATLSDIYNGNNGYAGYTRTDYEESNWNALLAAYTTGISSIKAADSDTARQAALDTAKAAMDAIAKKPASTATIDNWNEDEGGFDSGKLVGKVYVSVENFTFPGGDFTGKIIENDSYPIGENDSMMTVVLRALHDAGYRWYGTGGSNGNGMGLGDRYIDDYTITYLAGITKGDKELAEFSGESGSGWMGTLNDFFVNESLAEFSVSNHKLEDGDIINIVYTQNLGVDLGGTWGNSDTTLKSLELSTGTLSPEFKSGEAGKTHEFALFIDGSSARVKLTPHASNRNYLVRTFLNEQVKSEKTGNSYYKRSEYIPVKIGDTIYVGCGEYAWPSMNNQETEKRSYVGTWYELHVISKSNAAEYINDVISRIPAVKRITYTTYESCRTAIEYAGMLYDSVNKSEQEKVNLATLNAARAQLKFFDDIQAVKDKFAQIPAVSALTRADKAKVKAARELYDALSEEQQGYITVGDVKRFNAAIDWLIAQGEDMSGIASKIQGNELPVEQPIVEKVVETVKVEATVDSKGVAKAEVASKDISAAVKNATESKADSIVIAPEIKGEAKEVKVNLPKAAVSEIAEKTAASLVIETKTATVEVPSVVLNEIVAQAGGANVEISVTLKTADTAEVKEAITEMGDKLGGEVVNANTAVAEITVVSGNEKITVFGGKTINANVSVDGKKGFTEGKKYLTLVISENGKRELLAGKCVLDANGKLSVGVEVGHLSTFIVLDKELKSFTDAETHWSAKAVDFAVANGLMNGISDTVFAPNDTLNRAMLVTILYRLAGSQAVTGGAVFEDVAIGQWYSDAVAWAAENGIVTGKTENSFAPTDNITREQFATMLMRYCEFAGIDAAKRAELGSFTDSSMISSYANEALAWANANGIITGRTETTIAPKGNATRGEAATMLMRFMQL